MTAQLYDFLYEDISLKTVGLVVGLALVLGHLAALLKPEPVKAWLKALPRNEKFGLVLVAIDFAWALLVWSEMDLGEFYNVERPVQLILVAGCIGVMIYVREFLAVRAIGFFFILAAAPILDAAFLEPPQSRLLLVALSYAWIIIGMFWVGMPFLMRDQIDWALAEAKRWKPLVLAGLVYGALVLGCAVAFY